MASTGLRGGEAEAFPRLRCIIIILILFFLFLLRLLLLTGASKRAHSLAYSQIILDVYWHWLVRKQGGREHGKPEIFCQRFIFLDGSWCVCAYVQLETAPETTKKKSAPFEKGAGKALRVTFHYVALR
jgi:hypothetical protein